MSYWDTSALVPVFVTQRGSTEMRVMAGEDCAPSTSWLTVVEAWSALARLERQEVLAPNEAALGRAKLDEFRTEADEVAMTESVRARADEVLRRHALRAADALHLAAALVWAENRPRGRVFVSLDDRLRDAALREGFTILPTDI